MTRRIAAIAIKQVGTMLASAIMLMAVVEAVNYAVLWNDERKR